MASVQVMISIATIIVSFVIGIIFFYITSPLPKKDKKWQIEEVISLVINFVIFIWVGKIIINFSLFIQDPLAVLAYPSNSTAFYLAVLFLAMNVLYKMKRKGFKPKPILITCIPIFLVANFSYEFIQGFIHEGAYTWSYLGLLMVLILLYLFLFEKFPEKMVFVLLLGWVIGQVTLAFILPYITIFGYIMRSEERRVGK